MDLLGDKFNWRDAVSHMSFFKNFLYAKYCAKCYNASHLKVTTIQRGRYYIILHKNKHI